jgi:hypothetical protein
MEHADEEDIFVYTGGEQVVPDDVTHVIVDKSVKIIRRYAFFRHYRLASIEMHDGIEIIEHSAFYNCISLKGSIKLPGVRVVEDWALSGSDLTDVEFGDKLETIGYRAFDCCTSLKSVKMPTVRIIEDEAFYDCEHLTDVEMPDVERIGRNAFNYCTRLRRIAIPLRDDMFDGNNVFGDCENLSTVDVVGGIHKTLSSLHMESWRNRMREEIDRINRDLPTTNHLEMTRAIRQWIRSILELLEDYKTRHNALLKESMTPLELALWKAKLLDGNKEEDKSLGDKLATKKAKIDYDAVRKEQRIISGASIVIKNVIPFLALA